MAATVEAEVRAGVFRSERTMAVESVPDPSIEQPTDAVVRTVRSSVCGSDLWYYRGISPARPGNRTGHEITGVVEEVGDEVGSVRVGDTVVASFAYCCGVCEPCRRGVQTSCVDGGMFGSNGLGGHAERVRVPWADGTCWVVPEATPEDRLDSVHLLTDVLLTGYHGARRARVGETDELGALMGTVVVIGDGAVGLSAVASAQLLGATSVIACGHHQDRLRIAEQLGASHTTDLRGTELTDHVLDLTDGGAPAVLECVGTASSLMTAAEVTRPGGHIGMVGVPAGVDEFPIRAMFTKNLTFAPGVAPTANYVDEVGPAVASGELDVSPIASHRFSLEELPRAFEAMDQREAIKSIIVPGSA